MTPTSKTPPSDPPRGRAATARSAFTLFELLIVVGIIIMVLSVALPTIVAMLTSGADAQAYNVLSGQLVVARALASESDTYVAVHVQIAQAAAAKSSEDLSNACYSAITWQNPSGGANFELITGYAPNRMPGTLAFGEISDAFVTAQSEFSIGSSAVLADFTAFSIVFSPRGEVVKRVNGNTLQFATALAGAGQLWNTTYANGEEGATAITLFDYGELVALETSLQEKYLNENAQFLPVNTYTGRLFSRDVRSR